MASGDGLIVRVRPDLGRLTAAQALGLCAAAEAFGSGVVELTRRANLQIRGVTETGSAPLLATLVELGLVDPDPAREARTGVLVAPFWADGDATQQIAAILLARSRDLPELPAKFGFSVDAGPAPVLGGAAADVRIERGASGGLIVRADGAAAGRPVTRDAAAGAAIALARWFAANGGARAGRMARLGGPQGVEAPAPATPRPDLRGSPLGPLLGATFGQMEAATLARLVRDSAARALRLTPWRSIVLEGGRAVKAPGFVTDAGDAVMRADACVGAPFCSAASVETRNLARALAPHVAGSLHVSGCAKGCARSGAAAVTLVGRDGRYDLVLGGDPSDEPRETGLRPEEVFARVRSDDALHL